MKALRRLSFACALALCAAGRVAGAAPDDAAAAKAEADAAFDGRNYAAALEKYQAARARGGDARIEYNIAQTLTALERYPEALEAYQRFITEAPAGTLTAAQQERFFALLDELKAKISRLDIHCTVEGARVLVRGTQVATTPVATPVSLNAGTAKIEVIADGFQPFSTEVTLEGGKTRALEVSLERVDFSAALTVVSSVSGTHVAIDGADRGSAPLTLRVNRGTHVVSARADGYDNQSKSVTLEPGGKTEVRFFPVRRADYTLAWVGFVGGAAAVAGGAVTGVLAFTSLGSAKQECDTTTQQCGPTGQSGLQTSKTFGTFSDVFFGLGAAGLAVGVVGLYIAGRGHEHARPVEVVAGPGALGIRGTF